MQPSFKMSPPGAQNLVEGHVAVHVHRCGAWQFFLVLTEVCSISSLHVIVFQQNLSKYPKAANYTSLPAPQPGSSIQGGWGRFNYIEFLPHSNILP